MPGRLLVVEDNADIVELLKDILSDSGYEVESTSSGVTALLRLAEGRFDLVLLDIDVDDLSGLVVQRAVRDFSDVPTVVMSARSETWKSEALRAGATACLEKPFGAAALLRLAESIINAGRRKDGWPSDVQELGEGDLRRLRKMSKARLDALPFGVIRLDGKGRITAFNAYEAEAAGEEADVVIGVPFSGLAPCTKVKTFMKVVEKARRGEGVDEVLRFVFPRHGASSLVSVRLYAEPGGELWLFVSQRKGPGP